MKKDGFTYEEEKKIFHIEMFYINYMRDFYCGNDCNKCLLFAE